MIVGLITALAMPLAFGDTGASEVGFTVAPKLVVDLQADYADEHRAEVWTHLRAWARVPTGSGVWRFEARGLGLAQSADSEVRFNQFESIRSVSLGETQWDGSLGNTQLSIGHRIETWGSMYLLNSVDILNGRDLRAGPLTPLEVSRVPTPMLTASRRIGGNERHSTRAEVSVLPIGAWDNVFIVGTDWSLIKPGMVNGLVREISAWEGDPLTESFLQDSITAVGTIAEDFSPQTGNELSQLLRAQGAAPGPTDDLELAVRLRSNLGRHDISLMGAWMKVRQATPSLDPVLVEALKAQMLPNLSEQSELLSALEEGIQVVRPRTWFVAIDWAAWAGPLSLRAEGAWQQIQPFSTDWLGVTESPFIRTGAGVEWIHSTNLGLMVEGKWQRILNPSPELWLTQPDHFQVAMAGRLSILADRLQFQPAVLWDPTFAEWMIQPNLSWRPRDSLKLDMALLLLMAPSSAPQAFVEAMDTSVGPLGYVADNDSLIVSVTWIQ